MAGKKSQPKSTLLRMLSLVTEVKAGEPRRVLLLTLNFFLLFTAYYMIKPIREALILSMDRGAEIKSYTSALQAIAFIAIVPAYSALANRLSGRGILVLIYLFLISNLLLFIALSAIAFPYLGIIFFLWVGMFNLLCISQTWSLCNDIYTEEQGKRLFPLIAFGAASGAVFGPRLGSLAPGTSASSGNFALPMAGAAALLLLCALIVRLASPGGAAKRLPGPQGAPWKRLSGGLGLIAGNRYLLLIAGLVLIINFVNTTSEYMLGHLVAEDAKARVAAAGLAGGDTAKTLIWAFYNRFFFWVNLIVLLSQLFVVSRIIRYFGVYPALFALPLLALFSYSIILVLPILAIVRVVKIAENATDYSLNNTAREILFLPVSREEKYKAKLAVDTVFWRGGDALSGLCVWIFATMMGLGITVFASLNIAMVIVWIYLIYRIRAAGKERA